MIKPYFWPPKFMPVKFSDFGFFLSYLITTVSNKWSDKLSSQSKMSKKKWLEGKKKREKVDK